MEGRKLAVAAGPTARDNKQNKFRSKLKMCVCYCTNMINEIRNTQVFQDTASRAHRGSTPPEKSIRRPFSSSDRSPKISKRCCHRKKTRKSAGLPTRDFALLLFVEKKTCLVRAEFAPPQQENTTTSAGCNFIAS